MNTNQKLEQLRIRYKNEPANRKIITIQAKLLKLAQELQGVEPLIEENLKQKEIEEVADEVFGKEKGEVNLETSQESSPLTGN